MTVLSILTKDYASVFKEYFHLRLCNTMFTKTYDSNRPYLKYGIPCHMRNTMTTTTAPICPKIPAKQEIQAIVEHSMYHMFYTGNFPLLYSDCCLYIRGASISLCLYVRHCF